MSLHRYGSRKVRRRRRRDGDWARRLKVLTDCAIASGVGWSPEVERKVDAWVSEVLDSEAAGGSFFTGRVSG